MDFNGTAFRVANSPRILLSHVNIFVQNSKQFCHSKFRTLHLSNNFQIIQTRIFLEWKLAARRGRAARYEVLIKRKQNYTYLLVNPVLPLFVFPPAETRRAVQSEPQRADSFRVPCPGGIRVQPAPPRTRDHAPLQTPAADLLALVTHQEDNHRVLLLIRLSILPALPWTCG